MYWENLLHCKSNYVEVGQSIMRRVLGYSIQWYVVMALLIIGCKLRPPEPIEVYERYRKCVVLLRHDYYFKTTMDNGLEFYFVISRDGPQFFDTEEEVRQATITSYGTGFFISRQGHIATVRHLIMAQEEGQEVERAIRKYLFNLRQRIQRDIAKLKADRTLLREFFNDLHAYLSFDNKIKIISAYTKRENLIIILEGILENLRYNPDQIHTEMVSVFLGAAYDGRHVTSVEDYEPCVVIKASEDESIDIAILQLKDQLTPNEMADIFELDAHKRPPQLHINDRVYMIGYNHGYGLASTVQGIKSQFTSGIVTQEPTRYRLLYSIPTLPGSSGSPIIDEWGRLVAVNYAKTADFQGFSFGIPVVHLINLYYDLPDIPAYEEASKSATMQDENSPRPSTPDIAVDPNERRIRELLWAEDARDFGTIAGYYDLERLRRYWNLKKPSYNQLRKAYYRAWKRTKYSTNTVRWIRRENDSTYLLNTDFQYYDLRHHQWKTVNSTVRYVFAPNGKIVEVYGLNIK